MQYLQCQHFVDFASIVSVTFEMALHHGFEALPSEVWPATACADRATFPERSQLGHPDTRPGNGNLVSPQEESFEAESREGMIPPGRFHEAFPCHIEYSALNRNSKRAREAASDRRRPLPSQAAVGGISQKSPVPIANQPLGNLVAREGRLRRAIHGADKVVVQKWGSNRNLCLLERQRPVLMPWGLLEDGKGNWVSSLKEASVCLSGLADVAEELWGEQFRRRLFALKGRDPTRNLAPIESRHPDRRNFARSIVQMDIGCVAHMNAAMER